MGLQSQSRSLGARVITNITVPITFQAYHISFVLIVPSKGIVQLQDAKARALTYSNGMLLQRKIENGFCKHLATGKSLWGRWQALQDKRNVVIPVTPRWNQTRSFGGYRLGKKTTAQELSLTCILGSTGSPPPFLSSLRICSPVASSQTYNSLLLPRSALPPSIPTSGSPARARACWVQLPTGCHQRS